MIDSTGDPRLRPHLLGNTAPAPGTTSAPNNPMATQGPPTTAASSAAQVTHPVSNIYLVQANTSLRREVGQVRDELYRLQTTNRFTERELARHERLAAAASERNTRQQQAYDQHRKKSREEIEKLKQQLAAAELRNSAVSDANTKLANESERIKKSLSCANGFNKHLASVHTGEEQKIKCENASLKEQLGTLQDDYESMEEKKNLFLKQQDRLAKMVQDSNKKFREQERAYAQISTNYGQLKQASDNAIGEKNAQLQQSEDQVAKLDKLVTLSSQCIDDLSAQLKRQADSLSKENEFLKSKVYMLEVDPDRRVVEIYMEMDGRLQAAKATIKELTLKAAKLEKRKSKCDTVKKLTNRVSVLQLEAAKLKETDEKQRDALAHMAMKFVAVGDHGENIVIKKERRN